MKNPIIIGLAIVVGFVAHAWITKTMEPPHIDQKESNTTKGYGRFVDRTEYKTVSSFKQAAIEQLSGMKGETISLNGEEYFYIFLIGESDSGKGLTWEHNIYRFQNDSLVKIPMDQ